jgi:TonB family protein
MKFLGLSAVLHLAAAFVLAYWACPWIESATPDRRGVVDFEVMTIGEKARGAVVRSRVRHPPARTSPVTSSADGSANRPDAEKQPDGTETDNGLSVVVDGGPQVFTLAEYLRYVRDHNEAPIYPRLARIRGEQGRVIVRVVIPMTGSPPEGVEVGESSGSELLDRVALETAKAWKFPPFRAATSRITVLIPFKFALD